VEHAQWFILYQCCELKLAVISSLPWHGRRGGRGAAQTIWQGNFAPALSREPLIVASLLCSLGKLIDNRGIAGAAGSRGAAGQTRLEVHNVHLLPVAGSKNLFGTTAPHSLFFVDRCARLAEMCLRIIPFNRSGLRRALLRASVPEVFQ
jgi:hypothetical protein